MVMIGPVLERIQYELLRPNHRSEPLQLCLELESSRRHPQRLQDRISILSTYLCSLPLNSPQRPAVLKELYSSLVALVGVDPGVMDNIDVDFAVQKYSNLMNNDPKLIRSPEALKGIRDQRPTASCSASIRQRRPSKLRRWPLGLRHLSETDIGGGQNAMAAMLGGGA